MPLTSIYEIIENLIPTHNELRNPALIHEIRDGVIKASLSQIEDKWYVHDGHHRLVAYLKNPLKLSLCINITVYSLDDYRIENPPVWVTPFDPISEVRLPDFRKYKKQAVKEGWHFIWRNRHQFSEKREIHTMRELADKYE